MMPDLKPLKLLPGDLLYQQRDYADEIYMIKQGSVKLNVDVSDYIYNETGDISQSRNSEDSEDLDGRDSSYHGILKLSFPFVMYLEGSYFGDSDVLVPDVRRFERDATAVAVTECHFFVISREIL